MESKEEKIAQWMHEILEGSDCFIVSTKMGADANYRFFIDSDSGFSLDKSIDINRALRKKIEEEGLFPEGDYSLEISSPGIDEPLKMVRQYKKNVGRLLNIETKEEKLEGRLKEVTEEEIIIETKSKKKEPSKMIHLKLNNIVKATVEVEFK